MAARFSLFFSFIGVLLSTISVLTAANLLYPTSTIFMVVAVLDLLSGNVYSRPFGVIDDEFSKHPDSSAVGRGMDPVNLKNHYLICP